MERLGIRRAFSFDDDFTQYGFQTLNAGQLS
jgi:predicted nucleic acid-binding protein